MNLTSATLNKTNQWIVWEARKTGQSFDWVVQQAALKAKPHEVQNTTEHLKAAYVGTRAYKARGPVHKTYQTQPVNKLEMALEQVKAMLKAGTIEPKDAEPYLLKIEAGFQAEAEAVKTQALGKLDAILA